MPTRRDKRDTLALSAYVSGIELELIDGINVTQMSMKEYPRVRYTVEVLYRVVTKFRNRTGTTESHLELLGAGVVTWISIKSNEFISSLSAIH